MSRLSNIRRSWYILALFGGFFLEIGWFKLVRRFKGEEQAKARLKQLYTNQAVRFRKTALEMEGLLIKVGQFFSTRVDVLPEEYTRELAQLQDEVPPVPFEGIRQVIESELGGTLAEVYREVDPSPVAAASLGQVHKGILPSGEQVAIKVLRPGIDRIIEVDLKAFRGVIWMLKVFTDWHKTIDLDSLYRDFAATLREELDYVKELANLERFRQSFGGDNKVSSPGAYPDFSTGRVLTMQFVSGYKITDNAALREAGIDLRELAQVLVKAYLKQVLVDGFYHADPHPGNLFVRPDGGIIFIDFGMVGRITAKDRQAIRKIISSVISGDAGTLAEGLVDLGLVRSHANLITLRKGLSLLLQELRSMSFDRIGEIQVEALLEELREFVYSEPFQFPSNYTFLGRAVGTLSGLAAGLDPTMNILEMLKPYAQYILGEEDKTWLGIAWDKTKEVGTALLALPTLLEKTLNQAQNGDLQVRTELGPLVRGVRFQEVLVNRLVWTILFSVSALIATLFRLQGFMLETRNTMYVAGAFGFLLLLNLRKRAEKPLRMPKGHRHK